MTPERWQQVERLFHAALEQPPPRRISFLETVCADDPDLRREVESLLDAYHDEPEFLEAPAARIHNGSIEVADGLIGSRVGQYRIIESIGHGGMGRVYLGERDDEQFNMRVAIKVVKRGMDSEEIVRRFVAERQILASLDHPNIARLFDGGMTPDGRPFVVMEFIDGGVPLDDYCDGRRLSIAERLQLFRIVASAVHYAHQNLVVHRDLKMSNILVSHDGQVKLLDFGIAKILSADRRPEDLTLTATELRMLTPEYASPEQIRGQTITTAADIYSLGVLLYELLTGHRPYHLRSRSAIDIERIICYEDPTRPSTVVMRSDRGTGGNATTTTPQMIASARAAAPAQLRRKLSGDLDNIVLKTMHKEPQRRYASVEQLSEDIARHLDGMPVIARGDSMSYRAAKFIRRHRIGVAGAATLFSSVAGFGVLMAVQRSRIARQAAEIALQRDRAQRVVEFLRAIFVVADPWVSHGEAITAQELLDRGAERIDVELRDQPDVQAELMLVIGEVYNSLSLYERAERMMRRSVELYRSLGADYRVDLTVAIAGLAGLLRITGDYETSKELYAEALELQRLLLGDEHPKTVETINDFGILLAHRGEFELAEALMQEAHDVRSAIYPEDQDAIARTLNNLAELYKRKGDLVQAEELLRRSLAIQRRVLDPNDPDRARTMNNLAVVLRARNELDEADELDSEALELRRRILREHPDTAQSLNNIAAAKYYRGDIATAAALCNEALAMWRKIYGDDHPEVARALNNLAQIERAQKSYRHAEELFRESLEIHRRHHDDDHPEVARALNNLGELMFEREEYASAAGFFREALKIREALLGDDNWQTAASQLGLGQAMAAMGRLAEAEPLLRRSCEVLTAKNHRLRERAEQALIEIQTIT